MFTPKICILLCFVSSVVAERWKNKHGPYGLSDTAPDCLERLEKLERYIYSQSERIGVLEKTVAQQGEELDELKSKEHTKIGLPAPVLRDARDARTPHVAFSAFLDHRQTHVQIDDIIHFNKVLINEGDSFNVDTGIFSCRHSGTYLFTYSVNTFVSAYQLVVRLVLEGVNESDAISDPVHTGQEIQGENTVIFQVHAGQAVWVAAYNTNNTIVDGRPGYRFSTFSGFLIHV